MASLRMIKFNRSHGLGALALAFSVLAGCGSRLHAVPVDPNVDFAAHVEHSGLVIDEMPGVSRAVLVPAGWHYMIGGPRFLLQADDQTIAALWFPAPNHMIVRQSADPQSPLIGEIRAGWTEGAIHLTFEPANGGVIQSTTFDRIDGRVVTASLSSQARTTIDRRGTYRAELRDATGHPVGWLRVQISPYAAARRIYDGVVPAPLNGPLATAAVALLDYDVDYIRDHALDVHLGN